MVQDLNCLLHGSLLLLMLLLQLPLQNNVQHLLFFSVFV